ncbi:MAG: hypothetical protein EOO06_10990 [Chitinophagaceae bacterium]|nr:MAG: hypothetical protein EOO06_10990 [Chitinophagaceae bacterium]
MKKILITGLISCLFAACAENSSKEETNKSRSESGSSSGSSEADRRAKEIADSTRMLDKKLADPNDPTSPDSLK